MYQITISYQYVSESATSRPDLCLHCPMKPAVVELIRLLDLEKV
jgi:hypothetical protein